MSHGESARPSRCVQRARERSPAVNVAELWGGACDSIGHKCKQRAKCGRTKNSDNRTCCKIFFRILSSPPSMEQGVLAKKSSHDSASLGDIQRRPRGSGVQLTECSVRTSHNLQLAAGGARRARRSVAHATPRARWRGLSMRSRDLQAYGRICYNKRTRLSHPFDIDIAHALML